MWASIVSTTTGRLPQLEQLFLSNRRSYSLARAFGNLKVRPKLMVLHNLFFLVLTTAAYFSLIPLYEQLATDTRAHQVTVSGRIPNAAAQASQQSALNQARVRLFLVLGIIYLLAVVVLESAIMPWY